jgi:hypothetical protein
MQTRSLNELQKELSTFPSKRLIEICIRITRHKKENKELLSYLLFEAHDEEHYINEIKGEIDLLFSEMNKSNLYLAKKSLRKILRSINKYSKYSGNKKTETDLRIYYCKKMKESGIPYHKNKVLNNIFENQLKKIDACLKKLHEDLQFDFKHEIENLLI